MIRPYIPKALDAIYKEFAAGHTRQLLCMATGSGKTVVLSLLPDHMKDKLPGQTMVLLHRDELAKQAMDKMQTYNPAFKIQQEAGKNHADPSICDVIVASVQTLGRKNTKRLEKFNWENIDKYVVDEAHRSVADSYMNVYNAAKLLEPDNKRLLLGVTATPTRGDGTGLSALYQAIPFTYSLRQAIEDGWLADVKGVRVNTQISLDEIHTSDGDFNQDELEDTVNTLTRNKLVLDAYQQTCPDRIAIGFAVGIQHARDLAEVFTKAGIHAEAVWGSDPCRDNKIERFRAGQIQVLFNAQLLVEGFDLDIISCVILAAPTKSGVVFSQRIGRGTRMMVGKLDCIVLDIVDSTTRHNLITLPTLMGMPKGLDLRGKSLTGSIKLVEEMQKLHPNLDFNTLEDIDKIKAFCEQVDLFEIKISKEIEGVSELQWHSSVTGGYLLMLPDKDFIRIEQNLLDSWQLKAYIRGKKYVGERDTMEEMFTAADKLVRDVAPDVLKVVLINEPWHYMPPTKSQAKLLKKLLKIKSIPPNYTRGDASKKIGELLAGKEK